MPIKQIKHKDHHYLEKYPGFARNVRKRCKECCKKLSEKVGASIVAKKS